jgi:hypothetical protein
MALGKAYAAIAEALTAAVAAEGQTSLRFAAAAKALALTTAKSKLEQFLERTSGD